MWHRIFDDVETFTNKVIWTEYGGHCPSNVYYKLTLPQHLLEQGSDIFLSIEEEFRKPPQKERFSFIREDDGNYMLYDNETRYRIQIALEPKFGGIIFHLFTKTRPKILIDVMTIFLDVLHITEPEIGAYKTRFDGKPYTPIERFPP